MDYIYCLNYADENAVQRNSQPLEVTYTTVSCNLEQRQRSSQQILDFADYLHMHSDTLDKPIRKWNYGKSFSSDIPLWVELTNPKSFFDYFKDKFDSNDVMVIYSYSYSYKYKEIEEFCREQNWRCTEKFNVTGSEASVTILYDLDYSYYEWTTRAKTQLVFVTIDGKQRYYLKNFKVVLKMIYIFFFLVNSQTSCSTLRKETIMTKCVKNIAKDTKNSLAKNYQIVNLKATNPKFRT